MQSVHEALKEEKQPPPRAKSLDTILCLDVSASVVENPGLETVKQIALKFVDGVEDLMEEMDLEENIAVVTMGKKAKVIQHLTNDLSLVREAIESVDNEAGGRSPFMQALLVCLAANKGRGGIVNVAGVYKVYPRIIFITDGHPTDESVESGSDSPTNLSQVKFSLVQLITEISSKKHKSTPKPIFWVPVGTKANMAFLDSLAELCGGRSVPAEDIKSLCRYFKIHQTAGRLYKMIKNHPDRYVDQQMQSVVTAISPNLTINEQRTVLEIVMKLKDKPPEEEEPEADSFGNLYEDKEKVKTGELLPLGTRVVRGPDWKWKNQDTDGAGTVIQHDKENNWIYVKWDNGTHNAYRYNENGKVDVEESKHHPRELPLDSPSLDFGVRVVRGPDWKFENQDGKGPGIVVRWRKSDGKCKVRWDNTGTFHEYYYSAKRGHEVQIYTPQFARDGTILQTDNGKPTEESVGQTSTKTIPMWKWRDENRRWRLYSEDISV
ncbi:uncharacterized protein LOC112553731 [Pomacea canaliculata]|uniref:uncharacterized protein LOC112553731 n=1 Tax=Pomacea canaliculata TaxID=400727 RepID=UPI000D735B3B|nr:uncharacterized protein LOC112553731 [Pomacea canaliculata]